MNQSLTSIFKSHKTISDGDSSVHRNFHALLGNSQMLDGGAMFGNAPKALWQRWIQADEANRIPLACRCLLIEESRGIAQKRRILCEAGIGAFFEPKLKQRFGIQEEHHVLLEQLAEVGVSPSDIDVIVLSHLHFDHAGGVLQAWQAHQDARLCFPNAHYVVGEEAWQRAQNPHPRDRASFIPELPRLLEQSGKLEIVPTGEQSQILGEAYSFYYSHGHTPGQMHLIAPYQQSSIVFVADLIPGAAWVNPAITMGYDRYPEMLIDEKVTLLKQVHLEEGYLFFTHDPYYASAQVIINEKGKYQASSLRTIV